MDKVGENARRAVRYVLAVDGDTLLRPARMVVLCSCLRSGVLAVKAVSTSP